MTTDIDINALRSHLIDIYEAYLRDPTNPRVKDVAQSVYMTYWQADTILPKDIGAAVSCLIHIGVDITQTPTKEEIKQLVSDLKAEEEKAEAKASTQ